MLHTLPLLLAAACSSPDPKGDARADTAGDTASDTAGDALPDGLHGVPPADPVALPSFAARNQLGEPRAEVDLIGHPSVLWFYPAAGTAG